MQIGTSRATRLTALLIAVAFATSIHPVAGSEPNAAGLVVQYGDGSRVYAYVQFAEETISSEELLMRTGLDVVVAPFGGMGAAVCSINGEGCPSSRCWCQSYRSPTYFWHFYALQSGAWAEQLQGMSSRSVSDGDVDGWLWGAGDTTLPNVAFEDIAKANGVGQAVSSQTATTTTDSAAIETLFVPAGGPGNVSTPNASPMRLAIFGGMLLVVLAVAAIVIVRHRSDPAVNDITDA